MCQKCPSNVGSLAENKTRYSISYDHTKAKEWGETQFFSKALIVKGSMFDRESTCSWSHNNGHVKNN